MGEWGAGAGSKVTRCEALSCCGLRPQHPVTFQAPTSLILLSNSVLSFSDFLLSVNGAVNFDLLLILSTGCTQVSPFSPFFHV
jgi:hypothetical protein